MKTGTIEGRMPPHDRDLEEAVLGSVILESHRLNAVSYLIQEDTFYFEEHRVLWKAIQSIRVKRTALDLLTLLSELRQMGKVEQIGGPRYLAQLTNKVTSAANLEMYVRILAQYRTSRELIRLGFDLQRKGFQEGEDGLEVLSWAQQQLKDLGAGVFKRGAREISDIWAKAVENLDQPANTGRVITGLRDLDQKAGKLEPGTLTVLAARPGMGKTVLGLEIALANAKLGYKVAFFSLEMTEEQLVQRIQARESQIPLSRIRNRKLSAQELERLKYGPGPIPLFIDDTPAIKPLELQSKVAQIGGLDLVVVDYLQIMRGDGKYSNREAEVSAISRELKAISKQERCAVLALAQLSRETEKRSDPRPRLSDLRESGAIEQDADNIWFIYRPEYYRNDASSSETIEVGHTGIHVPLKGHVTILGEKYRQGGPFQAYVRCDLERMMFTSGPPGYASQPLLFDANNYPELFPDQSTAQQTKPF